MNINNQKIFKSQHVPNEFDLNRLLKIIQVLEFDDHGIPKASETNDHQILEFLNDSENFKDLVAVKLDQMHRFKSITLLDKANKSLEYLITPEKFKIILNFSSQKIEPISIEGFEQKLNVSYLVLNKSTILLYATCFTENSPGRLNELHIIYFTVRQFCGEKSSEQEKSHFYLSDNSIDRSESFTNFFKFFVEEPKPNNDAKSI